MIAPEVIADAIFKTEGGTNTVYPYGIKQHFHNTTSQQACINTILHAERDWHITKVDRHFIYLLADRYCPSSCDLKGNINWKNNMVRILHL